MKPFDPIQSHVVLLPLDDIDTDQIIPARFLKTTQKGGLGEHLFSDWRYEDDGAPTADFILNRAVAQGGQILLAGRNFGCGSSREHAPWALTDWGFRAVVASSFADIFHANSLKNGLLPVAVEPAVHSKIMQQVEADPSVELAIDLESQTLTLPDGEAVQFPIDPFPKRCLLEGVDQLGYLLAIEDKIESYEVQHG